MTIAAPARGTVHTADSAIATATDLAARFARGAAVRDRERILPVAEVEELSASGLLAITVPAEHGGAGLGAEVLAEVVRLVATGDPNLAQIPHSHFVYVAALVEQGSPALQEHLLAEVLAGKRFGNAQSEIRSRHVRDHATTLRPDPERRGDWLLDGDKGYATGALFAHWIPVLAHLGDDGPLHVAWVERDADGVAVVDDWDGLGQRVTASGTVRLRRVRVSADRVMPYHLTFERPQVYGAFAQLLHAAIDAGIARAAVREAGVFVTTKSRPYPDAMASYGTERAADDPLVVQAFGEIELQVRAAEALVAVAGQAVDRARAGLTAESAAEASLAVAAARAATTSAAVDAGSRLFEVAGTRSAIASLDLDRHWRNARTHTLHDPAAWKVHHLGRYAVDGTLPPNHGQI
ncbi:SfnB family sulfur acquisition oxidoreductase [Pimelobacter simplex]|uniref:Acyl-CoA dehydrogenase n=1 Tax=Nocardioides simplex TaxID=2045 RepID=A0A0A1DQ34_NOCSI|nr:SfnB family sulfur acquisition oxidoreductase [Pimelobacter simplex]AIY18742.1 Acyl-CoA dehydrogenase [Pimelobacter simplex]MCG8152308.1 SfnB family sulfur acquisition oxidoreductase [Pimelobacter simplex]GEB14423.1 SfnB family sulfur acquisition oxidoreductase [Pimelobacter simplex]SFM29850.1 sulfur acquisition oxidoreductase, SfnB family [Pimelobacter simplex]